MNWMGLGSATPLNFVIDLGLAIAVDMVMARAIEFPATATQS